MANNDSCAKSELRELLFSADDVFSQMYFVYLKRKRGRQGAKDPQGADGVRSGVCLKIT